MTLSGLFYLSESVDWKSEKINQLVKLFNYCVTHGGNCLLKNKCVLKESDVSVEYFNDLNP